MGIRVDEASLAEQLKKAGCEERAKLPYHKMLLNGELPYTIGGGIGQSRLCMLLLDRATSARCRQASGRKKCAGSAESIKSICCKGESGTSMENISLFFLIEPLAPLPLPLPGL